MRRLLAAHPTGCNLCPGTSQVSSTFFCFRKNEGLSTALLGRMLKSRGCFDRFEAAKRSGFHGDPDGQSAASLFIGPWEPSSGSFVEPGNLRSADARFRITVVLVIRQDSRAVFFKRHWGICVC